IGCLIAALVLGEGFLFFTKLPPTVERSPQAIVLLIDTSGSMDGGKLQEVKTAATQFVQRQDLRRNQLAVVGFGSDVQVGTPLTSDRRRLEDAIAILNDGGGTAMDLAIDGAALQLESTRLPKNVLLFTDGQPNDESETLEIAEAARAYNINLVAVATGDAEIDFLAQLTGDRNLVFYASSGQFEQAFRAAETAIYNRQLVESNETGNYGLVYGTLRIGGWTGFLALGTSLALIVGQNHYLHRRLLSPKDGTLGTIGGLAAGMIAGAIAQLIFLPLSTISLLEMIGRLVGWTILGVLVGGGMSFFVPNLKFNRGVLGGGIGGILGAIAFLVTASVLNAIAGRLIGALILGFFIGLMIAWIEQISRKAVLIVHWTEREKTTISLGEKPILLGSSQDSHVYLRKDQGYPPITAKIYTEADKIILEFDSDYARQKSMKITKQELPDGAKRKLGNLILEVSQNPNSLAYQKTKK
ncbi:MAG: vWA domain-containing protein, partial [Chroococcales cyanobacterium]